MAKKTENFFKRLRSEQERKGSIICMGIGPDVEEAKKKRDFFPFGRKALRVLATDAIRETQMEVPVFKFSLASFSVEDEEAYLEELIRMTKKTFDALTILDAKYSDTGLAAEKHAEEAFIRYGADAVTVNPYFGIDTIEPYLEFKDKGVIVVIRTSNPGSADYQMLNVEDGLKLYEKMALDMVALNEKFGGNRIGLFVGSASPNELIRIRQLVGDMPLLVPRIGKKGIDTKGIIEAAQTADGFGMMACVFQEIAYGKNPAEALRAIQKQVNSYRNSFDRKKLPYEK